MRPDRAHIMLTLSPEVRDHLNILAEKWGTTRNLVIRALISRELTRRIVEGVPDDEPSAPIERLRTPGPRPDIPVVPS